MGEIYMIYNDFDNNVYIGKAKNGALSRWREHIGYCLKNNQYLHRAMRKYGVEHYQYKIIEENVSEEKLNEREKYWIKYYNSKVPNGYNETDGGDGGNALGLLEWKQNNPEKVSEISRKTIKNAKLWRENNPDKAKEIDDKWRAAGQQARRKSIYMCDLNTGEILKEFPSIISAAKNFGAVNGSTISKVLRGITKSAYGYFWKYK